LKENNKGTEAKSRKLLWRVLVILCLTVFVASAAGLFRTLWYSKKEDDTFRQLADIVRSDTTADCSRKETVPGSASEPEQSSALTQDTSLTTNYAKIHQMNQDFVGWLRIEDTKIDYPVMNTPSYPQYYIRRDFYGKQSVSGMLFLGEDFDAESRSVIIYGHNMKNGTMFGSLDQYERESYWRDHPVLAFDTLQANRQYEVVAAFQTRLYYEQEAGFRYYQNTGDMTEEDFAYFMNQVNAAALYDTGIEPEYGDRLLILSTCSNHAEHGRFIVVARCRNDRKIDSSR